MLYFSFSCGTPKKNSNHAAISIFATSEAFTPFSFLTIHISLSDSSPSSIFLDIPLPISILELSSPLRSS